MTIDTKQNESFISDVRVPTATMLPLAPSDDDWTDERGLLQQAWDIGIRLEAELETSEADDLVIALEVRSRRVTEHTRLLTVEESMRAHGIDPGALDG